MNKGKRFIARGMVRVRTVVVIALLLVVSAFLTPQHASAAADLQNGCSTGVDAQDGRPDDVSIKSPFGSTPDVCLGSETNLGYYFQLAVTFSESTIANNPQVTAVDNAGNNIPMQQDTLKTLFVSKIPVHVDNTSVKTCDTARTVTITITIAGAEYKKFYDGAVCPIGTPGGFQHDTWVRTFNATEGDTGTGPNRRFEGYIGINYGQPYAADPESQYHLLERGGIRSIKITGGSCGADGCKYDNRSIEVGLTKGTLTIDAGKLTATQTYTIELVYSPRAVDNNMPYDEWTDHTFVFKDIKLLPTGVTVITPAGYGADKPAYYDINNTVTDKLLEEATIANTNCTVEGIGWIVCPVMTFLAGVNDRLFDALAFFLDVDPAIFGYNTSTGLYGAWNAFRGYANILFIVAFLIIIYSQITSVGITNYGIKKLLPKLIVAAILVNTSYYICQIAVDISNILGYGLKSLFTAVGGGIAVKGEDLSFMSIIGSALTVTGLAAGTVALVLAVSVPVVLAALLALLSVVLILIARQAAIMLLIAISPLAFVAWLLPNTEKWFKKWWDVFFAMLVAFPVISAIFGASALAAGVLATGTFEDDGGTGKIAALAVLTIPMFAVIPILSGMIKKLGAPGGIMGGWLSKSTGRIGSKVKSESRLGRGINNALGFRTQTRASHQTRSLAGNSFTSGALGRLGGKGYKTRLTNQASALEDRDFEEGIKDAESNFSGNTFGEIEALANNSSASDVDRTAAVRHIMAKGNFQQRQKLVESSDKMTERQRSAVSSGVIDRGDHAIYGAAIADSIKTGKIGSRADTERFVAQNIADGKVKAEAMVHDADAVKLIADVTSGGKTYDIKDSSGTVTNRAVSAAERKTVVEAADTAKKLPATASKVSKNFTDQYIRL